MAHNMGQAAAVMIVMGGFSLAALSRTLPAAWRDRIRHGLRRPARTSAEGTR